MKFRLKQIHFNSSWEALAFEYFPFMLEQLSCAREDVAAPGVSLCPHCWRLGELGNRQLLPDTASLNFKHNNC